MKKKTFFKKKKKFKQKLIYRRCFPLRAVPDTAPAYCYREVTQRPCRANLRRYSYDVSLNECVEFTFGGCSMSLNIFVSRDECEKRCKRNQTLARQLPGASGH